MNKENKMDKIITIPYGAWVYKEGKQLRKHEGEKLKTGEYVAASTSNSPTSYND